MIFYPAQRDRLSHSITALLPLLAVGLFFALNYSDFDQTELSLWVFIGTCLVLASVALGGYAYQVTSYELTETALVVHRKWSNKKVWPYHRIVDVYALTSADMGFVVRRMGNGGVFGYMGTYWSKAMGDMTWYVSNRDHLVVIQLTRKPEKVVLSPEDVTAFVEAIHLKIALK